ncbi:MAG: OsmC family peroxiredoxin [Myxococcales bacterium]|nr:OsmC family peroxiredoxin [Myxococcales bacterium]
MAISKATASWDGTLKGGRGTMKPEHGAEIPFGFASRFEGGPGSNPEELVGAALAGCFSMALSLGLEKAGLTPKSIRSSAQVQLDKADEGFAVKRIELTTEVSLAGGDESKFRAVAEETKKACPIGKLLSSAEITLDARLAR